MKTPVAVIISSVSIFLTAVASILFALISLSFSGFAQGSSETSPLILYAILALLLSVALVFIGFSFLRGKNWARITTLVVLIPWVIWWIFLSIISSRDMSEFIFLIPGVIALIATISTFRQKDSKVFFGKNLNDTNE